MMFGKKKETIPALSPTSYEIQCAWCLKEAGKNMGSGSHGICERHACELRLNRQWDKLQCFPSYVEANAAEFAQEASGGYVWCADCQGFYLPHEH